MKKLIAVLAVLVAFMAATSASAQYVKTMHAQSYLDRHK